MTWPWCLPIWWAVPLPLPFLSWLCHLCSIAYIYNYYRCETLLTSVIISSCNHSYLHGMGHSSVVCYTSVFSNVWREKIFLDVLCICACLLVLYIYLFFPLCLSGAIFLFLWVYLALFGCIFFCTNPLLHWCCCRYLLLVGVWLRFIILCYILLVIDTSSIDVRVWLLPRCF